MVRMTQRATTPGTGPAADTGTVGHLRWRSYGAGPPVLLLHGLHDDGRCWEPLLPLLPAGLRYVAPDARGHGGSGLPDGPLTADALAADVIAVLEAVCGPAVLVGHSMGGQTAAVVAARRPDLARALVLEDPKWWDAAEAGEVGNPFDESLRRQQATPLERLVAQGRKDEPLWPEDELLPWARAKHAVAPALSDRDLAFRSTRWEPVLAAVRCPVLLVLGSPRRGALVDRPEAERMRAACGAAVSVVTLDAGHTVRRDERRAYAEAVTAFLGEHVERPPAQAHIR
jgi:pimeloyl-ACP methyl ester carboxylesterase